MVWNVGTGCFNSSCGSITNLKWSVVGVVLFAKLARELRQLPRQRRHVSTRHREWSLQDRRGGRGSTTTPATNHGTHLSLDLFRAVMRVLVQHTKILLQQGCRLGGKKQNSNNSSNNNNDDYNNITWTTVAQDGRRLTQWSLAMTSSGSFGVRMSARWCAAPSLPYIS